MAFFISYKAFITLFITLIVALRKNIFRLN